MKTGHGIYAFHTSSDITELGIPMKEPRNKKKQHYIPNCFSQLLANVFSAVHAPRIVYPTDTIRQGTEGSRDVIK